MYKSRLQEICQKLGWGLPDYTTSKTGPDHMARFTATVKVRDDLLFETPHDFSTTSKEAQNYAARLAFDYINNTIINHQPIISPPPTSLPTPSTGIHQPIISPPPTSLLTPSIIIKHQPIISPPPTSLPTPSTGIHQPIICPPPRSLLTPSTVFVESERDSTCYRMSIGSPEYKDAKDVLHMYKRRLQQFGKKNNLGFPVYTYESEGLPHNRKFRSKVCIDRRSYGTLEFFMTLEEAEQAAAKVACQMLSIDVQEDALYKNKLPVLVQELNLPSPSYKTSSFVFGPGTVFRSSVEVGNFTFKGECASTKKQAEVKAAKCACLALSECCEAKDKESSSALSIAGIAVNDNLTQCNQSSDVVKQQRQYQDATCEEVQVCAKKSGSGASPQAKIVVFPRTMLNTFPVPENSIRKAFKDVRFVGYEVLLKPQADA